MMRAWPEFERKIAWNVGLGLAAAMAAWASWETRGTLGLVTVGVYVVVQLTAMVHSITLLADAADVERSQRPLLVIPVLILLSGVAGFITILRLIWNSLILHHLV